MSIKHYKLRFLPLFEEDLDEITDYIRDRLKNPIAADHLVDEVQTAIRERSTCAEAFEPYHSEMDRHKEIEIKIPLNVTSRAELLLAGKMHLFDVPSAPAPLSSQTMSCAR